MCKAGRRKKGETEEDEDGEERETGETAFLWSRLQPRRFHGRVRVPGKVCTFPTGRVASSRAVRRARASARSAPHIDSVGRRLLQNAGRSGLPNSAQRRSGSSCTQGMPAGLPCGMPGIGEVIEGAMQHAPHAGRQPGPPAGSGAGA